MNKTVKTVFLLIGTLVLIFLIWQLVFNDGGVVKTVYNSFANGLNNQWAKVAGSGQKIVPLWQSSTADDNGTGFEIDTDK